MTAEEFLEAEIRSRESSRGWPVLSRMWLATALCVLTALGLTWFSLEPSGTRIAIRFQDGHGLKPGDSLQNRGIEIGTVTKVELNPQLSGIEVEAELKPAAASLAREGTRFWIVRPTFDASGVSGLETAVGSKYIAVAPGPAESGQPQFQFTGLETAPIDGSNTSGLQLVLRAEKRLGINPGAPLTWRGIEIGQVLSCALSPDARHVDIQVRIYPTHQRLITSSTCFWALSGVQVDAGLTGLRVSAESLATVIRGGIGVITPAEKDARPARSGDVFTLHPQENEAWTEDAAAINLLELNPPTTLPLVASWQQKTLGFTRSLERRSLGIPIEEQGRNVLLVPASLAAIPANSITDSFQLALVNEPTQKFPLPPAIDADQLTVKLAFETGSAVPFPAERLRKADEPEDCFAARQSTSGETLLESIGQHELDSTGQRWMITRSGLSGTLWHGAAVLSARDGKLIGMLVADETGTYIAPLR